jgi:hypothetical protein
MLDYLDHSHFYFHDMENFAKVPKKRPKLCAKTIRERDGNRCQYTGQLLKPEVSSLDHVLPPRLILLRRKANRQSWRSARKNRGGEPGKLLPNQKFHSF